MELFAKVRIKKGVNSIGLIEAFFENFNPKSSIEINEGIATLKVVFESRPYKLISTIGKHELLEFKYEMIQEVAEEEVSEQTEQVVAEEVIPEQTEQEVAEQEVSEKTEHAVAEEVIPKQAEQVEENGTIKPKKKCVELKFIRIPEIEELAEKANSFDEFVSLVAGFLQMGNRKEYFKQLAIASTEIEDIAWRGIEQILKQKGVFYTSWDKISLGKQISKKLEKYSLTALPLFYILKCYKNYSFKENENNPEDTYSSTPIKMEVLKQAEKEVPEEEDSKQVKQSEKKGTTFKQTTSMSEKKNKFVDLKFIEIPQIEELAKKAQTFEEFVCLVADFLQMDHRTDLFKQIVIASTEVQNFAWRDIEESINQKGAVYNSWAIISIRQQISKKLEKYSLTALPFFYILGHYKASFSNKTENLEDTMLVQQSEIETENQLKEDEVQEVVELVETPKVRVKMECMPEIKTFEEVLGSVDKTQPIELRVRYVLTAMGWNEMSEKDQAVIMEFANTAVRLKQVELNAILLKVNIPVDEIFNARMIVAKFVNDFAQKYDPNKQIKLVEFLRELQKIIMLESEIKK